MVVNKETIDRLLTLKGKKQEDLAHAINLNPKTFSARKKTGKYSEDELQRMADFFGISVTELSGGENSVDVGIRDLYHFLGEKTAQQDGMLRVLLAGVSELLADKRGIPVEEMHRRIIKAVNLESLKNLEKLQ